MSLELRLALEQRCDGGIWLWRGRDSRSAECLPRRAEGETGSEASEPSIEVTPYAGLVPIRYAPFARSGEGGIRTLDRGYPLCRFSKPVPSATRPPLRVLNLESNYSKMTRNAKGTCGERRIRTCKPFRAPVFKTGAIAVLPALLKQTSAATNPLDVCSKDT